jgi:CheY-like chemotaxis protein
VICSAGGWLLAVWFGQIDGRGSRLWKSLLWTAVVLTAGVWGVFLAATVLWFGYYTLAALFSWYLIFMVILARRPHIGRQFPPANGSRLAEPVVAVTEVQGVRILVAEDDTVTQLLTRRLLERRGYLVQTASNGYEVLAALDRERFELVLMDLQMPMLDGLETVSMIRRREAGSGRALPIIALTARTRNGTRDECLSAGMNDYLAKPVDPAQLYRMVERHAGGRGA